MKESLFKVYIKDLGYLDIQINKDTKGIEWKEKNTEKEPILIVVEGEYKVSGLMEIGLVNEFTQTFKNLCWCIIFIKKS